MMIKKNQILLYLSLSLLPLVAFAVNTDRRVAQGENLFIEQCSACHGSLGQGGIGLPLNTPEFINAVDDFYIKATIQRGRPGRVMPAFDQLSMQQLNALVVYMRSWTGQSGAEYSSTKINADAGKGKQVYHQYCVTCHGKQGGGGKGTGVSQSRPRVLPVLAPALNNEGFQKSASDALIKNLVQNGHYRSPTTKPFKKTQLTEADYNNVVAYIRTLTPTEKPKDLAQVAGPPIIVRESSYDLKTTISNLKEAIVGENFRLIRIQTLDEGFVEKGAENQSQVIIYSCAFNFLYDALKVDPRIGLFLPCRVTVVEDKGKVKIMAINPKRMSDVFNNRQLDEFCTQMYDRYITLMEDSI